MQDWTRFGLPSRREVLRLLGAVAATGAVAGASGCASALAGSAAGDSLDSGLRAQTAQPNPGGTIVNATCTVSSTQNGAIELGYCGLSYEKDSMWRRTLATTNTDLVALFQLLNSYSILRVGGSTADQNAWTPGGAGATFRQIAPTDVTALNGFLNATGYKCIYGINLKGSINGGTAQTTSMAVAEVTAVANTLGSNLLEIEIGNEPDLYTDSGGTKFTWSEYKTAWEPYALAINNALPSVKLTGPTLASTSDIAGWTQYFAADEGPDGPVPRNVGFLTQHYYSGDAASHSYTDLLTPNPNLPASLSTLNGYKATYGLPWKMAETSDFYDSAASPNPSRAFASAMWLIDYLFQNIEANGVAINIHGGTNYQFAPINDDGAHTVTGVNALYYGAKMFTSGGYGNAVSTSISSPSVAASSHTTQVDSKHYSTFISNKDTTASTNMKVVITLPSAVSSATIKVLKSSGDLSSQSGFTINGSAIGIDGTFSPAADNTLTVSGSTVTCYVPFNCMVLVSTVLS